MTLFFICGPHCCGKSSILKRLEQDGDITARGTEIGKDLYYARKFSTETQGEAFEQEVAQLELQRDRRYALGKGVFGAETWHPGNMAYASVRNPGIVPALRDLALTSPMIKNAFGVWIVIGKDEICKRTKTFEGNSEWVGAFYEKVNSQIDNCLKELGLRDRITVIDGNQPLEDITLYVKEILHKNF